MSFKKLLIPLILLRDRVTKHPKIIQILLSIKTMKFFYCGWAAGEADSKLPLCTHPKCVFNSDCLEFSARQLFGEEDNGKSFEITLALIRQHQSNLARILIELESKRFIFRWGYFVTKIYRLPAK